MLAGRTSTPDASRCMDTNDHKRSQPSQQKPASSQQSCSCWTFARACVAICCDCDLEKLTTQEKNYFLSSGKKRTKQKTRKINDYFWKVVISDKIKKNKKRFSVLRKKRAKAKTKKKNDFRNVVISDWIPNAIRNLHASKYKRPRNKPNDGCLWKPAKRNSVRPSKQLRFVAITETFNGNQALESSFITHSVYYSSTQTQNMCRFFALLLRHTNQIENGKGMNCWFIFL